MENFIQLIQSRASFTKDELALIRKHVVFEEIPAQTELLKAGNVAHHLYFVSEGIVKGYQNIEGKLVVQHLVGDQDFFTSLDGFMTETPSLDYFETITDCKLVKISKPDFDYLQQALPLWKKLVNDITNEYLNCKVKRVQDFQVLTAKERYIKFVEQYPKLALHVSVENMASFLGIEPQSLSRIRRQITF